MVARELISSTVFPIRTSDTGNSAMYVMSDLKVDHLPVVNNEQLLGVISEEILLNHPLEEAVGTMDVMDGIVYAHENLHLFDIMRLLVRQKLTVIPVVDQEEHFIGTIVYQDLLKSFATSYSMDETGTTIIISSLSKRFSMSEVCQIIEAEGTRILCSFITEQEDHNRIELSLRVFTDNLDRVIRALERYDYVVQGSFHVGEEDTTLYEDRFNSLMNYLNI